LAYPETLGSNDRFFHDGTAMGIARSLTELANGLSSPREPATFTDADRSADVDRFLWPTRSSELDQAVGKVCDHV